MCLDSHRVACARRRAGGVQVHRACIEKQLCNCAAIGVHFIIAPAIDLDFDEYRRERDRDGRGCQDNLPEKIECLRMTAIVNGAHIPDYQRLGIHMCGAHIETTTLIVCRSHSL